MTPQESLNILDQASSLAPLARQGHIQVQQALDVLREAIKPKEEKKK